MKKLVQAFLLSSLCALPAFANVMGASDARHFLNRVGFDAQPDEIESLIGLDRREAVKRILAEPVREARTPVPPDVLHWTSGSQIRAMSEAERQAYFRANFDRGMQLRGWWVTELLTTSQPLAERMTLFWHNHFTTSFDKVRATRPMLEQNRLLRRHALGNFATMLKEILRDPAMLVYLDVAQNSRGQPNENFARELMELFTLGEGRYGEADVREAARALTGLSLDPETGKFRPRPFLHDPGVKQILGRSGRFDADDLADILLAQPATASFIVSKLWREFVSAGPADAREQAELERVADRFRASGHDIRAALNELLLTDAFWDSRNRGSLVKSPVDLVIGTLRQLDVEFGDPQAVATLLRQLGQDLFAPPNVRGWPGGEAWINSTTLLARKQFLDRLLRADEMRLPLLRAAAAVDPQRGPFRRFLRGMAEMQFSPAAWLEGFQKASQSAGLGDDAGEAALLVLLPRAPVSSALDAGAAAGGNEWLRRVIADPVFQLR